MVTDPPTMLAIGQIIATIFAASGTIVLALIAFRSLKEQRQQNYAVAELNKQTIVLYQAMLEEMRKSRPKPLIRADIESVVGISSGKGRYYDLVVKNVGREFARNIKVTYCSSEIPELESGGGAKTFGENDLIDSNWVGLDIKPLGLGDYERFQFDFILNPKIWFAKFKITYSDGVETYEEAYRIDVEEIRKSKKVRFI